MGISLAHKGIKAVFIAAFLSTFAAHAQDDGGDTVYPISETQSIDDERLDAAFDGYLDDDVFQTERPIAEPEPPPEFKNWGNGGSSNNMQGLGAFFSGLGSILFYAFIGLGICAILYVIYLVFGEGFTLRGKQKDKAADPDVSVVPDLTPDAEQARGLLGDADALAAQGRFAEAVHLLLFRSIDDIQEKRQGVVGRSLTAREIGALGGLPDRVRAALSPIIRIVERSFFGGRDVDQSGWEEARAAYQSFAFGEAWA